MEIVIDGRSDIVVPEFPTDKIGDILDSIRNFVRSNERAVISVEIDAEFVTDNEAEYRNRSVSDFKVMSIQTCLRTQLSKLTLTEVIRLLPVFRKEFEEVARSVQERNMKTAMDRFARLIDEWSFLKEAFINSLAVVSFDISTEMGKKQSVKEFLHGFNTLYEEISNSFKNEDWVLLADLLEYEMVPRILEFEKIVSKVKNLVKV